MNPKKKLLLLFLLDCVVLSAALAGILIGSLRRITPLYAGSLFLWSIYNMTRRYTADRLKPRETHPMTLQTVAKNLVVSFGAVLFMMALFILKSSVDVLFTNVSFLMTLWLFGIMMCFWRFADDLTKLKPTAA